MSEPIRIAAVQMVSGTDVAANLARAATLVAEAAAAGARLVVLPEYFCLMGREDTDKLAYAEAFGDGPIQSALAGMARQHGVWLAAGTVPLRTEDPGKVWNSLLLFDPDGQVQLRYDKIHLFGFSGLGERYAEADTILPGADPAACDTPLGRLAFGICYDLRFPELFRGMAPYDLLILPAAFTAITGEAHWEVLLRARAIENQSYVIAAAQGGTHENGRKTHGQSLIIDPWGRIVAQLATGEGIVVADMEPDTVRSVRTRLPALSHRVID